MPDNDAQPTPEELERFERIYREFLVAMQRRRRAFVTGTAAAGLMIGAATGLFFALATDYTWKSILTFAIMAVVMFVAGSWSGFSFAEEPPRR